MTRASPLNKLPSKLNLEVAKSSKGFKVVDYQDSKLVQSRKRRDYIIEDINFATNS
jgi:hypothetical protein